MSPFRIGSTILCAASLLLVATAGGTRAGERPAGILSGSSDVDRTPAEAASLRVEYLEIVTDSVEKTCEALSKAHGVVFGEPVPELGNARTADLRGGGRIGVRAPMAEHETPVVRPYALVDDIEAAVKAAEATGAEVAMPPTEIPGQGTFSIYVLGGIQHGLWQH